MLTCRLVRNLLVALGAEERHELARRLVLVARLDGQSAAGCLVHARADDQTGQSLVELREPLVCNKVETAVFAVLGR